MTNEHDIEFVESFHLRRPVLESMLEKSRWQISPDGKRIKFDAALNNYSPHERDIIEFALNPYYTAKNIFVGLDKNIAHLLAKAINELFGSEGFYRT